MLTEHGIWSFLTELALQRLGYTPLLLSTNNSVPAIAHLIKTTKAEVVLHCDKFASVMVEAIIAVKEDEDRDLTVAHQFIFNPEVKFESRHFPPTFTPEQEENRPAVILHSSGSTGFPKPVFISHAAQLASSARFKPLSALSTLPSFHTFGHGCLVATMLFSKITTVWPRHVPFSPKNIISFYKDIPESPEQFYTVPYILELLADTKEGVQTLNKFKAVWFGGAALSGEVGDKLEAAGVHVGSGFGMTEAGSLFWTKFSADPDPKDPDWSWLYIDDVVQPFIKLEPAGDDLNLVVLPKWPALVTSNRPDGSYDTKDLFQRHPNDPRKLRYLGRLDDTLTQSLGEKTNPVPIERAIRSCPVVDDVIVFGDKRDQCGALLIKTKDAPEDDEHFFAKVWPYIEKANESSPSHSAIAREMIRALAHDADVPRTPKLTIIRRQAYKKFADLIDDVYSHLQTSTEDKVRITDPAKMLDLVRSVIVGVLGDRGQGVSDDDDLFAAGIDSLKATKVSNTLIKKLDTGDSKINSNIVYDYPSIKSIADHLVSLTTGGVDAANDTGKQMTDMVDRWVARIHKPKAAAADADAEAVPEKETIVLTGATGSLGAHILADLAAREDVSRVVCLARGRTHEDARYRVLKSLGERHRSAEENKFVCLAADVNKPDFGLSPEEFEGLRKDTTAIMHIAWPVNFRLGVGSFEDHVGGAVHLLNLAMDSPRKIKPSYYVASSVSSIMGKPTLDADGKVVEDFPTETDTPIMGYGQSKWVVEKIVEASKNIGARATVLRIGQLCGDKNEHGIWNTTEAYPLMFRSATVDGVKALPDLHEQPSWLPVDLCSSGAVDIVMHTNRSGAEEDLAPHAHLYHLVNGELTKWSTILDGLRQGGLKFETVSGDEWWSRLSKSNPDVVENPTYKLLEFYQKEVEVSNLDAKPAQFSIKVTSTVSPTIAHSRPLATDTVAKWVTAWAESGFLKL